MNQTPHHCGFITLIGSPNVGKSTLLNRMLGQKLAITSARPQTTRNRIPGILTREGSQLIFIDTPGVHRAQRALNRFMVDVATDAIWETDAVALVVEAGTGPEYEVGIGQTTQGLLDRLKDLGKPVFLVVNKIDRITRPQLLPMMAAYQEVFPFEAMVPVCALDGNGVDQLLDVFSAAMPEGPARFPADALTILPERFIAAEMVREKLFRQLEKEVPYSTAVTIESWRDRSRDGIVEIQAVIHVERDSQKGIVIGKGGQMLKSIGTRARKDLQRLLGVKVHLQLFVRVERGWTRNANSMKKMGYDSSGRGEI